MLTGPESQRSFIKIIPSGVLIWYANALEVFHSCEHTTGVFDEYKSPLRPRAVFLLGFAALCQETKIS